MHGKYLHHHEFFHSKIKQGDSIVWRSLVKCKELIRQGMVWNVGDGKSISFWFDNWIDKKCLRDLLNVDENEISNLATKVSEFM